MHAGAHFVTLDFMNVIETGGDLMPMADQVRRAVAWIYKNAASFGGDPNRVYISGHSSGGHLGGVVLVTDWEKDFGLPKDVVKGGLLCSGMYDLKPARLSARSSYVKFTDEMEHKLSTQRHLDKLNTPVILAYGTLETPEFQRQTRDFAAAVQAAGKPVQLLVADGYNHFEIIETHRQSARAARARRAGADEADAGVTGRIPITRPWLWIPGSRLTARPGMTAERLARAHPIIRACRLCAIRP